MYWEPWFSGPTFSLSGIPSKYTWSLKRMHNCLFCYLPVQILQKKVTNFSSYPISLLPSSEVTPNHPLLYTATCNRTHWLFLSLWGRVGFWLRPNITFLWLLWDQCLLSIQGYPCSYLSLMGSTIPHFISPTAATTSNSDWVKLKWRNCPSISPGTVPKSPSLWSHFSIHFQSKLWHVHIPLHFYSNS